MTSITYEWDDAGKHQSVKFVRVGEGRSSYVFAHPADAPTIELPEFFTGDVPVTQAF